MDWGTAIVLEAKISELYKLSFARYNYYNAKHDNRREDWSCVAGGGGSRGAYDCLTSALILSNCGLNVLTAFGKYGNKIRGILSVTRFLAELTARC